MEVSLGFEDPFLPRRRLLGPGPSDVHPRVLQAMARPTLGHLDPAFIALMDDTKSALRRVFRTTHPLTFALSAPGSAAMECALVNLLEPGQRVLIAENGVFGARMADIAGRIGARVERIQIPWGEAVSPEQIRAALRAHPDTQVVAFVHAETSTGVLSPASEIAAVIREHGALSVMDCVTSLGGVPVDIDAWGIDVAYSGSQKCISAPPGLAPITFSPRAIERVRQRSVPVTSWFLDISLLAGYWEGDSGRSYHHTAPVNAIYGLHEALKLLLQEGLEVSWRRHRAIQGAFLAGAECLGLHAPVEASIRLPQLQVLSVPSDVDDKLARAQVLREFSIEIGGGLGQFAGSRWRVGLMGYGARMDNVNAGLAGLARICGRSAKLDGALDAAAKTWKAHASTGS